MTSSACMAPATLPAKTDTQSSERQAGTTPAVETRPRGGFRPTRLLNAAGTLPEPAVSVPSAKPAMPSATATAEPELEPPLMESGRKALRPAPEGEGGPARPVG